MADVLNLTIEPRVALGKGAALLRAAGKLPAVFYGKKEKSTPIALSARDFEKVWRAAGESGVVFLTGVGAPKEALIHDVARDPVTDEPRHVDFYVIEKGQKVEVAIPLEFTGEAAAVRDLGGTLVRVLHEVEIDAEPHRLPHSLAVDLTPLVDFEARILAQDIALPDGVSLVTNPAEVVALAAEAREEAPAEAAPDLSTIEVEKKGKVPGADGADAGEDAGSA